MYQIALGCLTIPLVFLPIVSGRASGPISPAGFFTYLSEGMQCLTGSDPETAVITPESKNTCGSAPLIFVWYIGFNVAFNLIMMLSFKHASSTVALVASALRVALAAFLFTIPFIAGPAFKDVTIYDGISLIILLCGLVLYQWQPEYQVSQPRVLFDADAEA